MSYYENKVNRLIPVALNAHWLEVGPYLGGPNLKTNIARPLACLE